MKLKGEIYCIGDSHVSVLGGKDELVPIYPLQKKSLLGPFKLFRIGPVTAYNFCEEKSTTNARAVFENILQKIPLNSWLLISAGEIDCRVHLINQAQKQGKKHEEICDILASRFINYLSDVKARGYNIILLLPPPTKHKIEETPDYPSFGTEVERNLITKLLIASLTQKCNSYDIPTIGVFEKAITTDFETRKEYLWDGIHLSTKAVPDLIFQIRKVTGFKLSIPFLWSAREITRNFINKKLK